MVSILRDECWNLSRKAEGALVKGVATGAGQYYGAVKWTWLHNL